MATPLFALLGISASSLVNTLLSAVSSWMEDGAAQIVSAVGTVLDDSSSVTFGSTFSQLYESMRTIGGALALPFLTVATIQALLRQDGASLVRTVLVRAPVALLGSGIAIWIVEEGLAVTDAFSSALLTGNGTDGTQFTTSLAALVAGSGSVLSGFEGVILALLTAMAAFFIWFELVIRSSAVLCAALFIPLALAGVIWPITGHWIRRLGETIAALVLAKLAIVAVLVLAIGTLGQITGVAGVVEGGAILLLASLAPFALLRLLPFVEQGATGQFEGVSRRAIHTARAFEFDRIRHPFGGPTPDITPTRSPVPQMAAQPVDRAVFKRAYTEVLGDIDEHRRSQGDAGGAP